MDNKIGLQKIKVFYDFIKPLLRGSALTCPLGPVVSTTQNLKRR